MDIKSSLYDLDLAGDIKSDRATIFSILKDRGIIKITGEDAGKFLQSLITNDIYAPGSIYAMMLSPQGRYLFDFFITPKDGEYWLEADRPSLPLLIQRLNLYKLRSKVLITDVSDEYSLYYSHQKLSIPLIQEYRDPRYAGLGFRTIALPSDLGDTKPDLYLCDKYHYAIPDGGTDLIRDKSMPQEYGMDRLFCIDYHKGCYVGQEVISRTKYQGVIRKGVCKIISESDIGSLPQSEPIMINDNKVGILCSSYGKVGIGLLRFEDYYRNLGGQCYVSRIAVEIEMPTWG